MDSPLFDPEKDLQEGDLRLKLIKHAESPYAFDKEIYNQSGKLIHYLKMKC